MRKTDPMVRIGLVVVVLFVISAVIVWNVILTNWAEVARDLALLISWFYILWLTDALNYVNRLADIRQKLLNHDRNH